MKNNIIFIIFVFFIIFTPVILRAAEAPDFILSWSADTYVSPYYIGKALPSVDSFIKITAVPIAPLLMDINTLKFNWFSDGRLVSKSSGEGKSEFIFKVYKSAGSTYEIKLRVLYPNSKLLSQKTILIPVVKPEVMWQTTDTTEAIPSIINPNNDIHLAPKQNFNFIAQPLFFNAQKITDLNFFWQFDTQKFEDPAKTNQHIFSVATDQIGEMIKKVLNLTVINKNKPFEKNRAELNLIFTPFGK